MVFAYVCVYVSGVRMVGKGREGQDGIEGREGKGEEKREEKGKESGKELRFILRFSGQGRCHTVATQSRHGRDTVATQSRHSRDMVFLAFPAREHKRSTSPEKCLIPRARFAKKTMSRLCRDCVATVSRPCRDCVATVWHLPWVANPNKRCNFASEERHFP